MNIYQILYPVKIFSELLSEGEYTYQKGKTVFSGETFQVLEIKKRCLSYIPLKCFQELFDENCF